MPEGTGAAAGAGAGTGTGEGTGAGQSAAAGAGSNLTLTQAELEAKIQSESDKRVTQAIKTAQAKWEEEFKVKLQQEKTEAERLASLSAAEREQALLERTQRELAEKERTITQRELKLQAIDELSKANVPPDFADWLIGETGEKTKENISKFKKLWETKVDQVVTEKLRGKIPMAGNGIKGTGEQDPNVIIRRMAGKQT